MEKDFEETSEVVKEVRRMRYAVSEKFGHELSRLAAYHQEVEKELRQSGKYKFASPPPLDFVRQVRERIAKMKADALPNNSRDRN